MTEHQRVTLWTSVFKREQFLIYELVKEMEGAELLKFWKVMSLKSKCVLVE